MTSPADDMLATVKSYVVDFSGGSDAQPTARPSSYELENGFSLAGALAPPVDPTQLAVIARLSSAVQPCIKAVATNVDGFGYQLEQVIDLEKADAASAIRDAIIKDRMSQGDATPPTDADVEATRLVIERGQLEEKMLLERFFEYVCPSKSFIDLRVETRLESEGAGNAYWECARKGNGEPAYLDRVEQHSVRLRRVDPCFVMVTVKQRRSPLAYEEVDVPRRFRSFVQLQQGMPTVFYKEYGDPRVLSSNTGKYYRDFDELAAHEPGAHPANEMVHWRVFDTLGPYGLPTWYAAQFAVLGTLYSERLNHNLINNNNIPPMAIFINGGKLSASGTKLLEDHIKATISGPDSWHKILILEAESTGGAGGARCKIELHPLMAAQQKDQMFQEMEANNFKKVKRQWRLPDLLVGESQEVNRAQAEAAIQTVEQQVFQPLRGAFDAWINRFLFPELGIVHWRFKSNSPVAKDPSLQTELGTAWMNAGALTPNEGRVIAGEVFNREFEPIDADWANVPQPLALAGIMPGKTETGESMPADKESVGLAQQMIALRDTLREDAAGGAAVAAVKKRMAEATRTIRIPDAEFEALFEREA